MNRTLSHLDALLERRNLSGGDRLASLNRSIDSIERKLGNLGNTATAAAPNRKTNAGNGGTSFEELERRVRELTNGLAHQDEINARPTNPGMGNPLAEIAERKRVLNNSSHLSASQYSPHGGEPPAPAAQTPAASQIAAQAASAEIRELSERIDTLRNELAGELNGINKSVAYHAEKLSSSDDLDRIAQGIRELQQAPSFDPSAFDNLHRELDEIRSSLGASVRHEEFDTGINDLNVRLDQISGNINSIDPAEISEIKNRLDQISSNTATDNTAVLMSRIDTLSQLIDKQSSTDLAGEIKNRLDQISSNTAADNTAALMSRIDNLSQLVDKQSSADVVSKLDQRLQSLASSVEQMANNQQRPIDNENDLKAIESRLDEITRAIVAVSVTEQNQPVADNEALARLEGQITALAQGVESVVRKNNDEQFDQLASRIENLAGNLEAMGSSIQNAATAPDSTISNEIEQQLRELASRLDMGAVEKHRDDDQLNNLASRIDGLTEKFSSFAIAAANGDSAAAVPVTVVPDTSQLENQLQQLADRLDSAIGESSADNQLQNLENQIADIAAKLGSTEPVTVDLGGVESRLGAIEENLGASKDFTLEAATMAAKSAVEMMGDQGFSGELINALAEDLRALQTAANQTEFRTIESIDNVQLTLNTMVSRLGAIENQMKNGLQAAAPAMAATAMASPLPSKEEEKPDISANAPLSGLTPDKPANIETGSSVLEKVGSAPSIDPSEVMQKDHPTKVEDNRPLEPGSGAPDISALVKRASENLSSASSGNELRAEKTDFVAAARRAAQAAVSEVQAVKAEVTEKPQSESLLSKVKEVPRKPIIIAAAAVLMAVMAFAGSKFLFGNNGDTAIVAVNPVAVEEPAAKTVEEPAAQPNSEPATSPVTSVRPAVSNSPTTDGNMTATINTGSVSEPTNNSELTANGTSSFNTATQPKQTDKFTARTEPKSEMMASSTGDNGKKPEMSAATSNESITSAPLPPAQLGSTALRQAAAKGDVRAQHEVALRYTNGTGVKRDLSEAAKWYERAAAQEFAPAQYRLGSLYEKGLGVKRDLNTAMNWYNRAAELGNARAMHNLAVISAMGANGKPDMSKALSWFTNAANHGVKDSQFNLGILYGQGMGVKQNLAESYKWFALAAKTGDNDAAKKRDEVANVMDPKALEKARIVVRDWRPEKLVASANQVTIPEEWRGKAKAQNAAVSAKDAIRQTQMMLNKLGYKVGAPDGKFGPKTRRAIVNFQRKAGLAPTGTINADLVKALKGLSV